ncbi:MAG: SBBP repeat-containing protein [Candidatus Omnitrophota bacterium]
MKNYKWLLTIALLVLGVMAVLSATIPTRVIEGLPSSKGEVSQSELNKIKIDKNFGKMPLYFIPNEGQLDKRVFYYVQGKDKTIYFTSEGVTFSLSEKNKQKRWTVQLEFVGARKDVKPVSLEKTGTVISYFKGKESEWKTGISTASKIMYRDLWPGIDLVYYGTVNRMKYEFVVHPGADPNRIKLAYHGVGDVRENAKGQLEVKTPAGNFHDETPLAWQDIAGKRVSVPLKYALQTEKQSAESYNYGFSVGKYDRNQPLILDPAVIVYCGYIGGSGTDIGYSIAIDNLGCAYLTGQSDSSENTFPAPIGPDVKYNGAEDCFVAKIKADGTGLVYCGYIGGSKRDYGSAVAVDRSGCAYISGGTLSNEATFPLKIGPDLTHNGGSIDAFVAKVKADGTGLIYCGYIGGSSGECGNAIAVDEAGCAYVTGDTRSSETTFPVKSGPKLTYNNCIDCFVAKVKADGAGLIYCGYIAGDKDDRGNGIAVDGAGCAYVTGETLSSEPIFPVKIGPDLTHNGSWDVFVAKIKPDGTGLIYCGYIGGASSDRGCGIALDDLGCVYVVGDTCSTEETFPVKVGPAITYYKDADNSCFVSKIKPDGTDLSYCGYIGGFMYHRGYGIDVDATGCAYVVGQTSSDESTFPVKGGPDLTYNGGYDAFVAKIKPNGNGLDYCGYIGSYGVDQGFGIALDLSGNAYITGLAGSLRVGEFPVIVGPDITYNGGSCDAFIAKVSVHYTVNFFTGTDGNLSGATNQVIAPGGNSSPVTAVPNTGYRFVTWTGTNGFVTSTDNPLTVKNVQSDMTITANFTPAPTAPDWTPIEGLQYNMIAYGKAYKISGIANEGDWIGAFGPGGASDCRGLSRIGSSGNYYLTINSNTASGEVITFKLWPLPNGPSMNAAETICFTADETLVDFPLHFGALEQKFTLVNGWNWISFNVLPANTSLDAVFGNLGNSIEQIKTQNKAAIHQSNNWTGDLTNMSGIANGIMYKIKVNQNCTLTVNGIPIPFNKPISLVTNWNWTAYLPTFPEPIEKALKCIFPQLNQVKAQMKSAVKSGSSFIGDLTQMEPNKGYMIKMNAPATLVYPYSSAPSPSQSGKVTHPPTPSVPWKIIKGNQYNMIAHGNVYIDGKPVNGKDYYVIGIGPGGDSDCRSISPVGKWGSFFATILGNTNGEIIRFKLYSSKNASTFNTGSSLVFKADELKSNLVVSF